MQQTIVKVFSCWAQKHQRKKNSGETALVAHLEQLRTPTPLRRGLAAFNQIVSRRLVSVIGLKMLKAYKAVACATE